MKTLRIFLLLFIFVLLAHDVGAVERANSSVAKSVEFTLMEEKYKAEVSVLEKQLSTMKEYHSSMLDTVYWALATVGGIAFVLVGYGWFTNFKLHESEKNRLKEDFEIRLGEVVSALDLKFSSFSSETNKYADERYDLYVSRVNRDNDILRSDLQQLRADFSKTSSDSNSKFEVFDVKLDSSARKISRNEAALRQVEEYVWESRGLPMNIFITQVQGLRAAVEAGDEFFVRSILQRIEKCLNEKVIPSGSTISRDLLKSLKEDVQRASGIDAVLCARVHAAMDTIKTSP